MNNLTATELSVLNNLSHQRNPLVSLGTKLQEMITTLPRVGTPVNAVEASMDLTLTGVVIHGETVMIDNPLIEGMDCYEFLADEAQSKSFPTNIGVDITAVTVKSTGELTVDTQPTSGDTMTIGEKVYIFVPVGTDTADGEISIGADLAGAQANIVAAINGTDGVNLPHPLVTASDFTANVCMITALIGGTAGDLIATEETFTAETNVFAAVTLGSGGDCSASNAVDALVAAITASGTQGVIAADKEGDVISLTAEIAGAAGNDIVLGESLANGAFTGDAVALAGGVDGTVGSMQQPMIDESYLYICIADNTEADKNWRRISLGAAY